MFDSMEKRKDSTICRSWYSRGYLLHFDEIGVVQHITYHLADSIPQHLHKDLQRKLDLMPENQSASIPEYFLK